MSKSLIKQCLLLIITITVLLSCKNKSNHVKNEKSQPLNSYAVSEPKHLLPHFKIYVENSGSMDGYISQPSEFKHVLKDFASDIGPYFNDSMPDLYFVNSNGTSKFPLKAPKEFTRFISELNPKNSKEYWAPGRNSTIDDIIDYCTKNMNNNVSILFTDCILSYEGTKKDGVVSAQDHIKMFMSKKIKDEHLSATIIKFNSKFKGAYYNESNGGTRIDLSKQIYRPYYALIFGNIANLRDLFSRIDFSKYEGYESSYTLLTKDIVDTIESEITYKNKIGSFEYIKPSSELKIVKAETKNETDEFQFSMNVNLKKLPLTNDFITDINNYSVNENFKLKSVEKNTDNNEYSHTMTFFTNDLKQISNLRVGLKYSIPQWVKITGSEIDDKPTDSAQQKQTFGFKYLMTGVSQAYIANYDSLQFSLPISIVKNGAGTHKTTFPWKILLLIILVLGIFIYLKNKN